MELWALLALLFCSFSLSYTSSIPELKTENLNQPKAIADSTSPSEPLELAGNITAVNGQLVGNITTFGIKDDILAGLVSVGSGICSSVKRILGVDYEALEGAAAGPDLNSLRLVFKTAATTDVYNIATAEEDILRGGKFDDHNKLVLFLHGFIDDPTKDSFHNISASFLAKGGYNVMALDGSSLIRWLYLRSTTYVRLMGEKLGKVFAHAVKDGLNPDNILIVGHSLGSHIAGFAGKTFFNLTGKRIGRISSLDPAGPCFSNVDDNLRLKYTDAQYVDVIHTDAGVYGLTDAIGHADFYVNGGNAQPKCFFQTCSHSRAWLLYAESVVNEDAFLATECKDWKTFEDFGCKGKTVKMGFPSDPSTRGKFYIRTTGDWPYGLGTSGVHPRTHISTLPGKTGIFGK